LSTAPNRSQAKKGIVNQDQNDAEFTEVQQRAHQSQLELAKEKNRHEQAMLEQNLGFIGKFFGDGKNTPTLIALICVLFGGAMYVYCLSSSKSDIADAAFWSENASRSLNLAITALAYIFGKSAASAK
jgi:hypothetical protein